jgi:hypothetical protein
VGLGATVGTLKRGYTLLALVNGVALIWAIGNIVWMVRVLKKGMPHASIEHHPRRR